ncbi:MAG: hypothetical protein V7742_14155 [Halioglobus sp.]
MSNEIEAKLEVLDHMNRALGKITNVQARLMLAGEDDLAKTMSTRRKALLKQIDVMHGEIAENWTVNSAILATKLQAANRSVQTRIRNIQKKVNVASNAVAIIGKIDDALEFLKEVAP